MRLQRKKAAVDYSIDFSKRYEKLPVTIFKSTADASGIVVDAITQSIALSQAENRHCVLGLCVGSESIEIYEELVCRHKKEKLSFENVHVFLLDEYFPLDRNELQSHYRFLKEYFFDHIEIPSENIHAPYNMPKSEVAAFCAEYEAQIEELGGIDIMLLSDMGFNEPGSPYNSPTRLITLNYSSRVAAASDFYGISNVPHHAITMGVGTILAARQIFFLAWGEGKAKAVQQIVEGNVHEQNPASYLQQHQHIQVLIDEAASEKLTRIKTPWLTGTCEWTDKLARKAVFWLCRKLDKPILKLTDRDYNDNGMGDLVTEKGPSNKINIKVFNDLQHTITGWPGGKPNADDSTRPERAYPFPKKVVVFSPHPDDDVISMGGTLARLSEQGHELHVAYQVSGNIAVFDHDAVRFLDFVRDSSPLYGFPEKDAEKIYEEAQLSILRKHPGEVDSEMIRQVKTSIRRGEAKAACRFINIPEERIHFLDMPFYETGTVKKKPIGEEDVQIIVDVLQKVKPHQIYAAGDLSDPHGTHRVCFIAILRALDKLKTEAWLKDCRIWLYRGAWQEWDVADANMAVPLSPEEVAIKREAIFKHQSQKDRPLFPGSDSREFWQRAEERNHATAVLYDKLGMAEYQAIELFVRYDANDAML